MRPSLSYFILYLGIEGELDELSVSNNEVFFEKDLQKEYQSLYENRISEEAPFYLLAPSKVNSSHAPKGKSTLCLSIKAPLSLQSGLGSEELKMNSPNVSSTRHLHSFLIWRSESWSKWRPLRRRLSNGLAIDGVLPMDGHRFRDNLESIVFHARLPFQIFISLDIGHLLEEGLLEWWPLGN